MVNKRAFSTTLLGLCLLASGHGVAQPLFVAPGASPTYTTQDFATNDGSVMLDEGFPDQELNFVYGTLDAPGAGTVTYTFLGSGAGYTNTFNLSTSLGTDAIFTGHQTSVGYSYTQQVTAPGVLDFSFQTLDPQYMVINGSNTSSGGNYGANEGVFGIVTSQTTLASAGGTFADLLIYNDPVYGGDHDYNDLVVGVNFTPVDPPDPPARVPEPASLALLGLGFAALRFAKRKEKKAA